MKKIIHAILIQDFLIYIAVIAFDIKVPVKVLCYKRAATDKQVECLFNPGPTNTTCYVNFLGDKERDPKCIMGKLEK